MAVEMLDFRNFNEREVHKAASATLESVQNLIHLLSQQQQNHEGDMNYGSSSTADAAVNRLKKAVSMFGNTRGHARFRKAPSGSSPYCHFPKLATTPETEQCKKEFQYAQDFNSVPVNNKLYYPTPLPPLPNTFIQKHNLTFPEQSNTSLTFPSQGLQMFDKRDFSGSGFKACKESVTSLSSPISSLTASGVDPCDNNSNNNKAPCVLVESLAVSVRPPWSSAKKSCSHAKSDDVSGKCATAGRCHCSKRKKSRVKRTLRVPAISLKMADIPSDEFSWRKYGQKPIKGSPHPRGYYKCSTVRGCPARKHVERAVDDPNVLIVTYEGEHYHSQSQAMSESTGLVVDP